MSVVRRQFVAAVGALVCVLAVGVPVATAVAPETPITRQASSVTGESAVLNGELNPGASSEKVTFHFAYKMGTETECTGGGFSSTPSEEVEGNHKTVAKTIERLEGNTEYTFCLIAANPTVATGAPQPFTTLPIAPVVVSEKSALKAPDPFVAELKAEVNPENEPGIGCVFEYGPTTEYGMSKACTPPGEGVTPQTVSAVVEGLEASTTYHYRVVVANPAGDAEGAGHELKTEAALPPEIVSESSSNPTPSAVTVSATVNPEFQETSCEFQYGTNKVAVEEGKGKSVPCGPTGGSASLENLESNEEYFYRVVVKNETGLRDGTVQNFKTRVALAPAIETVSPSVTTPFEVTLEASLNPAYELTTCEVEYGETVETVNEHKAPCVPPTVEGGPGQKVSLPLTGLEPAKTYHYRVVVTNATGSAEHEAEVTTPSAKAPAVKEAGSSEVTPFTAKVSAKVNPEYQETSCTFQYATEEAALVAGEVESVPCETETRKEKVGSGGSFVEVTGQLTGLEAGRPYYFRVVATNATGTTEGPPTKLTTGPERAPSIVSKSLGVVKESLTSSDAKLEVMVEPNYEETDVTFEYSSSEALVLEGKGETAGAIIPAGLSVAQPVSVNLQGALRPNTTYYYRVSARNKKGSTPVEEGKLESFKTVVGPLVVTGPAIEVGVDSATLVGTVDSQGEPTTYRWAYVQQPVYEEALLFGTFHEFDPALNPYLNGVTDPVGGTEGLSIGSARAPIVTQPVTIDNLAPGTTYHYALVAENELGSKTVSVGGTFTTRSTPPTVGEASVSEVTQSGAKISGSVNGEGLPTRWEVLLGTNPAALEFAASGHVESAGTSPIEVAVGPLAAGTVYYYEVVAVSPSSPVNGKGEVEPATTGLGSFTTVAAPPPPGLAPVTTTPLLEVPKVKFPEEPKVLTNKQKLEKALKVCKAKRAKSKRVPCEKQARKRYGTKTTAKKSDKKSARG